jgi:hypothetical protein
MFEIAEAYQRQRGRSSKLWLQSFRSKGEIFLRSFAFAQNRGSQPVTWRALRLCARHRFPLP